MLSGYKTYILAAVAFIAALANWLVGDVSLQSFVSQLPDILLGPIMAALRAGVAKSGQ